MVEGWRALSSDPNSDAVLARRAGQLDTAWRPPVEQRWDVIGPLVAGRHVLDVGCVDHQMEALKPGSLHAMIRGSATSTVAADISAEGIEALRAAGEQCVVADLDDPEGVAAVVAAGPFDVVVAGELIEHLTRPVALFELAAAALRPGGRLVITTPNPYALHRVRSGWAEDSWENVDHLAWSFPSGVVELAERCGLTLESCLTCGANAVSRWGTWRRGVRRRVSLAVRTRRRPSAHLKHHELPLLAIVGAALAGGRSSAWLGETAVYVVRKPEAV